MDFVRFDAFVKDFSAQTSRREGFRVLLAGLAAGALGIAMVDDAAACKNKGQPCTEHNQCCANHCKNRRRHRKGRKAVGKCDCSRFLERCKAGDDCCVKEHVCDNTGCEDDAVCCKPAGADCADDCDCCGDNVCAEESFKCEPRVCSETREFCDKFSDCCDGNEHCDINGDACDRPAGQKVCCHTFGFGCEESCDCCSPLQCDDVADHCGADGPVCCREAGADCDEDCECCLGLKCDEDLEQCVAPSCLEPGQRRRRGDGARVSTEGVGPVPCPPGDPVLCCQAGDTCCTLSPNPVCCPPGTECTAYGCMPPCPEDHDACGTSELSCGQGPQFQGCKCIRWNDHPFCARRATCFDCQEDADCGHPSALCIPCEFCEQQNPAVATACVFPCVTFLG